MDYNKIFKKVESLKEFGKMEFFSSPIIAVVGLNQDTDNLLKFAGILGLTGIATFAITKMTEKIIKGKITSEKQIEDPIIDDDCMSESFSDEEFLGIAGKILFENELDD